MKNLCLILFLFFTISTIVAQPPQAFKYQAVVRDNTGEILQNQAVCVRISIHDVIAGGTIVYQETFTETTNQFGLVNLEIGNGIPTIGIFDGIDWSTNSKFIETEIDPAGGTTFVSIGTTELLAVPYALYSNRSKDAVWGKYLNSIYYNDGNVGIGTSNPVRKLHIKGTTGEVVRFESEGADNWNSIYNSNGYIGYFGAYNGDHDIDVGTGGGNSLGKLHLVTKASPRLTIDDIGNVGIGTTNPGAMLEVAGQVKITGGDPANRKALITDATGFASWQYSAINDLSDGRTDAMSVFLGSGSGILDDGNNGNTAIGQECLTNNTEGFNNTASGYQALYSNTGGDDNIAIGSAALYNNTTGSYNTASGRTTLYDNTTGHDNNAIGYSALANNTTGNYNTANGSNALNNNSTGSGNIAIGFQALLFNTTGEVNTACGMSAMQSNTTGSWNTAYGHSAFTNGESHSNSTALGFDAEPEASNKIILGNSSVSWIGGHSYWYNTSDARVKTNIKEDVKGLDFIMELRPVTYYFDKDKMDELTGTVDSTHYPEKYDVEKIKQSGFMAQEVEQAAQNSGYDFSGISKPKGDVKYYSLAYAQFVVPLVKAVQEQQGTIETLKEMNKEQQTMIIELKSRIEKLEMNK